MKLAEDAVAWAEQLSHPYSLAYALLHAAHIYARCRKWEESLQQAERSLAFSLEHAFLRDIAVAQGAKSLALTMQGNREAFVQMRQDLAAREAAGSRTRPSYYARLADACLLAEEWQEGLNCVTEGLSVSDETDERCLDAELNRLKGEFSLLRGREYQPKAEADFHHALSISRLQQAKLFEIRAATSLARLWQSQGKRQKAYELLEPVYGWFTEGFDTADLKDARALVEELSES